MPNSDRSYFDDGPESLIEMLLSEFASSRHDTAAAFMKHANRMRSKRTPAAFEGCWVPGGQTVSVQGRGIPGGLLYVGQDLKRVKGNGVEPALIIPTLSAKYKEYGTASGFAETFGNTYCLSYAEATPGWRAGYLDWLAGGRCAPDAAPGYPILFLYGLERRALADTKRSADAAADLPAIADELHRMLSIYSNHSYFEHHARLFLELLSMLQPGQRLYDAPPPTLERYWQDIPAIVSMMLAQLAADGKPLQADWAFAILRSDGNAYLRTPAARCLEEFKTLFALRYAQKWPKGIMLKPTAKTEPLSIFHYPASATFSSNAVFAYNGIKIPFPDLPAVTLSHQRRRTFHDLALECCNELDPYSRWLGRNETRKGAVEGWALLPADLRTAAPIAEWAQLSSALEDELSGSTLFTTVPAKDLIVPWLGGDAQKPLTRTQSVPLMTFMEQQGFGMEPDLRFGRPIPKVEDTLVIFRSQAGTAASLGLDSACAIITLIAALVRVNGDLPDCDTQSLYALLKVWLTVQSDDALRLGALLRWLLIQETPPKVTKMTASRILPCEHRTVLSLLTRAAGRIGPLQPQKLALLEKMYGWLGAEPSNVARAVYAARDGHELADNGPVVVRPGVPGAPGFTLPPPSDKPVVSTPAVRLDMKQVAVRHRETEEVSGLLNSIFKDETPAAPAPAVPTSQYGLTAAQCAFLKVLCERPSWERSEWEALAASHSLLPGGAWEVLNEAALEALGEPALDGDDPLFVNLDIAKELYT